MTKKKKTETPVVVENPDNLPSALFDDAKIDIKGLIRVIRGQQVMLDFDLAQIYGYETKNFNRQVKNNIERFDSDFMFQLDNKEWNVLRSQIATTEVIEDEYVTLLRSQIATAKLVENELDTNLRSQIATSNLSKNEQDADWISHFATSNSR